MCGCTLSGTPASSPARDSILPTTWRESCPPRSPTNKCVNYSRNPSMPSAPATSSALQRLNTALTLFDPSDRQLLVVKQNCIPPQRDRLTHPQRLPEHQQREGIVSLSVSPLALTAASSSLNSFNVKYSRDRTASFLGRPGVRLPIDETGKTVLILLNFR